LSFAAVGKVLLICVTEGILAGFVDVEWIWLCGQFVLMMGVVDVIYGLIRIWKMKDFKCN